MTEHIDSAILNSEFVQHVAVRRLRVCCYGSSSSDTPEKYLAEARSLGYILAKRGHVCVNGAGSYGCMAAMNDGAAAGDGHIVGVIHEMWLVDKNDWGSSTTEPLRDGGAHPVFANGKTATKHGGPHPALKGPKREMLVAGGKDLQERKRLLVEKANGLIVLPGGPGTWDELWEMACARGIGLSTIPIVCVNVDGYYESFKQILQRAYDDKLTKLRPHEIVHFENTAEEAVKWIEAAHLSKAPKTTLKSRSSALRKSSFLHGPILGKSEQESVLRRTISQASEWVEERRSLVGTGMIFIAGLAAGVALGRLRTSR